MTRFILSAIGSYGDVHPMVGLGAALAARGHDVKLITNPYFADLIDEAGLELLPIGSSAEYLKLTQHPDLWHPLRGARLVLGTVGREFTRPIFNLVCEHFEPGNTVVGAHTLDFGGRVAAEHLDAPLAAINYAPAVIWSEYESPRLKGALVGPRVPRWLKRFQHWVSDRAFVLPLVGPVLNELRREVGLAPETRVFGEFLKRCDLMLCMFPEWFGQVQPDWPQPAQQVGFPLWDTHAESQLRGELRDFLAAGPPPIAFSPGSANRAAHQFFAASVEACERLGRRGLLLTKYADQLPAKLPLSVRHFGFIPLSHALPQTAALVHHGGIGTCAQGLAAGVPQLVRPLAFDQYDNAARLRRLGVAEEISVRQYRGPAVAAALERLLTSPTVAERCRELATRCNGRAALAAACVALETLAPAPAASATRR